MTKNIIKEIIISLLLLLAIILVLGVLLYEYVPMNKIIPEKISYTTPEEVKDELQTDSSVDDTEIVLTHQIDATDLTNYKKIQEYVPGKKNPFEDIEEDENTVGEDGSTTGDETKDSEGKKEKSGKTEKQSSQEGSGSSTSGGSNSGTGYLPDKGTK